MDERFTFWVLKKFGNTPWPGDTGSHVFLGNAVNQIGKALFGAEWTGAEPTVASLHSWPNGKLERFGHTSEDVAKNHAAKRPAMERFSRVRATIIRLAEAEQLATALRPPAGGDPVPVHRSMWNSERLDVRFRYCAMSPREPFGPGVWGDHFEYIFVTRESLDKCLAALMAPRQPAEHGTTDKRQNNAAEMPAEVAAPSLVAGAESGKKISVKARAEKFREWRESRGANIPTAAEDIAHMKGFGVSRDVVRALRRSAQSKPRGRPGQGQK